MKPIVGQKVWVQPIFRNGIPVEMEVTKVGKKYFTAGNTEFEFDGNQKPSKYNRMYVCYFDIQEYYDKIEKNEISLFIRNASLSKLTLGQLRHIKSIIENSN